MFAKVASQIHIPSDSILAEKIILMAHKNTLHGGVLLTMTKVRETYWIPTLRQTTKSLLRKCHTCKKFNAKPYTAVKPGQ